MSCTLFWLILRLCMHIGCEPPASSVQVEQNLSPRRPSNHIHESNWSTSKLFSNCSRKLRRQGIVGLFRRSSSLFQHSDVNRIAFSTPIQEAIRCIQPPTNVNA
ncbi:hypothetical protein IWX49DRAFT_574523 [Phyllosticta citricarpa]